MGLWRSSAGFVRFWTRTAGKYEELKNGPQRETSVKLGVQAIVQTVVFTLLVALCLWGMQFCVTNYQSVTAGSGGSLPILTILGIFLAAALALVLFVRGNVGALICLIYQFKLNRKAVRWVALAVWLAAVAALIVVAVLLF